MRQQHSLPEKHTSCPIRTASVQNSACECVYTSLNLAGGMNKNVQELPDSLTEITTTGIWAAASRALTGKTSSFFPPLIKDSAWGSNDEVGRGPFQCHYIWQLDLMMLTFQICVGVNVVCEESPSPRTLRETKSLACEIWVVEWGGGSWRRNWEEEEATRFFSSGWLGSWNPLFVKAVQAM